MTEAIFHFDFRDLKIDASRIEHVLGENKGEELDLVRNYIDDILEESPDLNNIKAQYITFNDIKFDDRSYSIKINNICFNIGKIIFNQIKKSESIAVLLSTAGEELAVKSGNAINEGDLLKGYIYDIFGSLIVGAAMDLMTENFIKSVLNEGEKISAKYSPGYCGWNSLIGGEF